jgi:hypothetical protein
VILHERKYGTRFPAFDPGRLFPHQDALKLAVRWLVFGAFALVGLFAYMHNLGSKPIGWVVPLSAAAQSLGLVVVLATLALGHIRKFSSGIYLGLERDLVLEQLPTAEIRSRFVDKAMGTDVREWLNDQEHIHDSKVRQLRDLWKSVTADTEGIDAIREDYQIERAGRASKLRTEFDKNRSRFLEEIQGIHAQLAEFSGAVAKYPDLNFLHQLVEGQLAKWRAEEVEVALLTDGLNERLRALSEEVHQS